ncbi:MAG TPA: 1-deoxy-D-xylulose-5-phosphate reductoisomerase [Candidatus Baltobacteraceae bacterium]
MSARRRVAILGSTGSIGTQALDVIARHPDRFEVVGLAAGRNAALLREQVARFGPAVATDAGDGPDGLRRVALETRADIVLAATDGFVAFDAVFAAVERGIDIAVANKELIVAAGELLVAAAARSGSQLLPVDSEHSAVFQCLAGEDRARVAQIVLTASGGPFLRRTAQEIAEATVEQALAHPTWQMGTKNTVDSASLMNKGLEVIEASRLFGLPGSRIAVVVHPQSIAHAFAVFTDGSVKAQLCAPDMRVPIGYALAWPDRLPACDAAADALTALGAKPDAAALRYEFERPDLERFPCLRLAYEALEAGGTAPAVLSAANEVAVSAFVQGRLRFGQIPALIEKVLRGTPAADVTLEGVRAADRDARVRAAHALEEVVCS